MEQPIPLRMFSDSKSPFDVMIELSLTAKKSLSINIMSAREAYDAHEISNVVLLKSKDEPGNIVT